MVTSYIALGSNLGKRQWALRTALDRVNALPNTRVTAVANFRQTDPVDAPPDSPAFINSAARLETSLNARDLLNHLLEIENSLGRQRSRDAANAPRTIDLDLLLHGDEILHTDGLILPHPRMSDRLFVLEPLADIAPDAVHPVSGKTVRQLLADLMSRSPEKQPQAMAQVGRMA